MKGDNICQVLTIAPKTEKNTPRAPAFRQRCAFTHPFGRKPYGQAKPRHDSRFAC